MRKQNPTLTTLGCVAFVVLIAISVIPLGLCGMAIHSLIAGNFVLMWKCLGGCALAALIEFVCVVFVGAAFSKN